MATMLFETEKRTECHNLLEGFLFMDEHPLAECREFYGEGLPYSIWDGPQDPNTRDPEEDVKLKKAMEAEVAKQVAAQIALIVDLIATKVAEKQTS